MAKTRKFIRLGVDGTSYELLIKDWQDQCEKFGEDFDSYSQIPISVFDEIMQKDKARTGLYALVSDEGYEAVCMLNHADIPNYAGPVLRVRHILLSPTFDLGDLPVQDYASALVSMLMSVIQLSETDDKLQANHIKFHVRSPADMPFFTALGTTLGSAGVFHSVQHKGTWLYITKK